MKFKSSCSLHCVQTVETAFMDSFGGWKVKISKQNVV